MSLNLSAKVFFTLTMIALLSGCSQWANQWTSNKSSGGGVTGQSASLNGGQPAFSQLATQIVGPKCVSCHGNSGGVNLENYANFKSNLSRVYAAIKTGTMPPPSAAALNDYEKSTLLNWITAGAPEQGIAPSSNPSPTNSGSGGTPPPPPTPFPIHSYPPLSDDEALAKLNFTYVRDSILVPRCISCHDTGSKIPLDTLDGFKGASDKALQAVFLYTPSMPPFKDPVPANRVLTEDDRQVLYNYIIKGSPEGGDVLPRPSVLPTYDDINKKIFQVRCMDCHSPGTQTGNEDPLTKEGLVDPKAGSVNPGHPELSDLITAINQTPDDDVKPMPPAKRGYTKLPQSEIDAITLWIKNGAKD
jgi:mono/diheme cytochrome c family protein